MNAWTRIALLIGCIAAPLSFSAVDAHPPQIKRIGEALTAFKKLAHAPVAVGECDIKEGKYTTHVVLYIRAETELFEIENSGKNFHYLRTSGRPIVFVYEHSGVFEEIPLDQMNMILRSAGARSEERRVGKECRL